MRVDPIMTKDASKMTKAGVILGDAAGAAAKPLSLRGRVSREAGLEVAMALHDAHDLHFAAAVTKKIR